MAVPASTLILTSAALTFTTTALLLAVIVLRLQAILPPNRPPPKRRNRGDGAHLMVVLGSGGHTAEMIAMLATLDTASYTRRTYVVSSGDGFSANKAAELEEELEKRRKHAHHSGQASSYTIITVPRARRIHQPLYTAPVSVLQCLLSCMRLLRTKGYPDIIITNGPATGCIVVVASVILRFLDLEGANSKNTMRTVYAESFARVKTLSLTGWLLQSVVDRFGVQWPDLAASRREYWGILV